jgi:hypothetical protein
MLRREEDLKAMSLLHASGRGFPAVQLSCDEVVRLFGIGGTTG